MITKIQDEQPVLQIRIAWGDTCVEINAAKAQDLIVSYLISFRIT